MRNGLFVLLAAAFSVCAQDPVLPIAPVSHVTPVVSHLTAPESLRPCCAFGYDLHVRAIGVPIPVYQIGNVLTLDTLGRHHYNDSALGAVKNLVGLSEEKNGLIYTRRGGFIDIAHVRDTADNTFYLFSRIFPNLGQSGRVFYSEELGGRRIQLNAFMPPASMHQRYEIAAWLAGYLAYELAQWHEIAQWYGFQSVPGFSEEISAFSPEDLYSNLLGARLAINVILQGHVDSVDEYNQAMESALKQVLVKLTVAPRNETEAMFRKLDGDWWNSKRRVPDKFLVLKRNYALSDTRLPTPVPFENAIPYQLTLPVSVDGFTLAQLGQLQIHPGHDMRSLPMPDSFYTPEQFQGLADRAQQADKTQLERIQLERIEK
ncbi:DUF4056 domain-containing protein [Klebsiella oxytoca]|uniref:DUF4056 domain-containing protein n=1 Tax=Klebsiella oxytoca TaxID=571 RepID=UPI00157A7739|nr:DUF4056 domain-containing protein [Klebsiella oxytoca]